MLHANASFETPNASKYLQQLCKHFAHKVPAEWTQTTGHVEFPMGQCELSATDRQLDLHCWANTADALPTLVKVVEVHLERFAFREPPTLVWLHEDVPASDLNAQLRAMPDPHKAGETDED